jgi:hypothetical protein
MTVRGLGTTQSKSYFKCVKIFNDLPSWHIAGCWCLLIYFSGLSHGEYEWKDPESEDEVYAYWFIP